MQELFSADANLFSSKEEICPTDIQMDVEWNKDLLSLSEKQVEDVRLSIVIYYIMIIFFFFLH